jgi:hypothetical protein
MFIFILLVKPFLSSKKVPTTAINAIEKDLRLRS